MSTVAVAIVNYNTRDHLRECLTTVAAAGTAEVVVVDNGSTDGSADMVRAEFPGVTLHVAHANPGYGGGANRAVARCRAEHVLLLNSDTRLRPGALAALAAYMDEHPRVGVVGPRLLNPDGTLQPSCFPFPTPLAPALQRHPLDGLLALVPALRERRLGTWSHDRARRVPWVLGAAMLLRRAAFEAAGGFDEGFFLYFEEVDLCYRLRAAGWETHFVPATEVTHVGRVSTSQYRPATLAQSCRSAELFYRRHYRGARLAQAVLVLRGTMALRLLRDAARRGLTRDANARRVLDENVAVWRGALRGVASRAPLSSASLQGR